VTDDTNIALSILKIVFSEVSEECQVGSSVNVVHIRFA
jgi:hypothetical protein